MIAVKAAPARIPRKGLENFVIKLTKCWESRRGIIAALIIPMPRKRIPRPAIIPPANWTFFCLTKRIRATPANAINGAMAPMSRAMSWPVTVVPILAPMMIQTACLSVMSWELTKPTTMTVVADEDWMIAVIPAPTNTPKNRLAVSRSRICFMRLPAAASRLVLIICMPYKNNASPPNRLKNE